MPDPKKATQSNSLPKGTGSSNTSDSTTPQTFPQHNARFSPVLSAISLDFTQSIALPRCSVNKTVSKGYFNSDSDDLDSPIRKKHKITPSKTILKPNSRSIWSSNSSDLFSKDNTSANIDKSSKGDHSFYAELDQSVNDNIQNRSMERADLTPTNTTSSTKDKSPQSKSIIQQSLLRRNAQQSSDENLFDFPTLEKKNSRFMPKLSYNLSVSATSKRIETSSQQAENTSKEATSLIIPQNKYDPLTKPKEPYQPPALEILSTTDTSEILTPITSAAPTQTISDDYSEDPAKSSGNFIDLTENPLLISQSSHELELQPIHRSSTFDLNFTDNIASIGDDNAAIQSLKYKFLDTFLQAIQNSFAFQNPSDVAMDIVMDYFNRRLEITGNQSSMNSSQSNWLFNSFYSNTVNYPFSETLSPHTQLVDSLHYLTPMHYQSLSRLFQETLDVLFETVKSYITLKSSISSQSQSEQMFSNTNLVLSQAGTKDQQEFQREAVFWELVNKQLPEGSALDKYKKVVEMKIHEDVERRITSQIDNGDSILDQMNILDLDDPIESSKNSNQQKIAAQMSSDKMTKTSLLQTYSEGKKNAIEIKTSKDPENSSQVHCSTVQLQDYQLVFPGLFHVFDTSKICGYIRGIESEHPILELPLDTSEGNKDLINTTNLEYLLKLLSAEYSPKTSHCFLAFKGYHMTTTQLFFRSTEPYWKETGFLSNTNDIQHFANLPQSCSLDPISFLEARQQDIITSQPFRTNKIIIFTDYKVINSPLKTAKDISIEFNEGINTTSNHEEVKNAKEAAKQYQKKIQESQT